MYRKFRQATITIACLLVIISNSFMFQSARGQAPRSGGSWANSSRRGSFEPPRLPNPPRNPNAGPLGDFFKPRRRNAWRRAYLDSLGYNSAKHRNPLPNLRSKRRSQIKPKPIKPEKPTADNNRLESE